jgi:hypothetical protein
MSLPKTEVYLYESGFEEERGELVEFRLIYRGKLPSAGPNNSRNKDKHRIRLQFHKQLRLLWNQHPSLHGYETQPIPVGNSRVRSTSDIWADQYARCGHRFLPLVSDQLGIACSLDILFLRRDNPGGFIVSGGDIDNRLKVLFDALRIPENCSEVISEWQPSEDENPLYCLMEDDRLIHEIKVTTDHLILPMEDGEALNDVVLIIHVKTKVVNHQMAIYELG